MSSILDETLVKAAIRARVSTEGQADADLQLMEARVEAFVEAVLFACNELRRFGAAVSEIIQQCFGALQFEQWTEGRRHHPFVGIERCARCHLERTSKLHRRRLR